MIYDTDTFARCEALIRRHAPLWLRVEPIREERERERERNFRPPTTLRLRQRMKKLRQAGMPIGDIARACRVTWRTAWKYSRIA